MSLLLSLATVLALIGLPAAADVHQVVSPRSNLAAKAVGDVMGSFDLVGQSTFGEIQVLGWAADSRNPDLRLQLHVYVTGPDGQQFFGGILTGQDRPDVAAVYGWPGSRTGYSATLPTGGAGAGSNSVCVYAISAAAPLTNPMLGCRTLDAHPPVPAGSIDSVTVSGGFAVVSGWTFDPNRRNVSNQVHIYVNSGGVNRGTAFVANNSRPDVNSAYGISGRHGFGEKVKLGAGSNSICAYGIGENGNNALIGGCSVVQGPGSGKPTASNTGVPDGIALTPYTGPLTITADGTVIDSKDVYGDLRIQARNVVIRNSYLHGGSAIPSSNSGVVDANSANVYNLLVENNTIRPDSPSYFRDGIVGHEFTATGNDISRSNDGIGAFSKPGGPVAANVTIRGNYIHDLTHWNNDPAHSDGTHNDGIQLQGGENILISGNNVVGSVVAGDGLGPFGNHGGAALIINRSTATFRNVVVETNWFDDAQNSVCINNGSDANITVTLQNNFFGRNQFDFGNNSTYQIRIYSKSKSAVNGLATNRWEDTNVLLTEGRNTGIRYNGA
jgi:hypothetical protein